MFTSKSLGAVCAGALLLTAGCTSINPTLKHSTGGEAVTAVERFPLAVLDERVGQVLAVTFAFDRETLDRKARSHLDAQAAWMAERPELHFSVTGHADKVGNPAYNLDLGRRRAERVVEYLVGAGIDRGRLKGLVSHGEYKPLVETESPERLNRRVVIEVTGVIEEVATLDAGPWWRHTPEPNLPNLKDGPNSSLLSRSFSDTAPSGSSSTSGVGSKAPASGGDGDIETTVTFILDVGESSGNAEPNGGEAGSSTSNQGPVNPRSTAQDPETSTGSDTGTGTTSGSSTSTSQTSPDTPSNPTSNKDGGSVEESGSGQGEDSTDPETKTGSHSSGKGKDSKDSGGKPSKSNPSNDRTDAGRGNGPEEGGDPGKSGGRNQGGDDD